MICHLLKKSSRSVSCRITKGIIVVNYKAKIKKKIMK